MLAEDKKQLRRGRQTGSGRETRDPRQMLVRSLQLAMPAIGHRACATTTRSMVTSAWTPCVRALWLCSVELAIIQDSSGHRGDRVRKGRDRFGVRRTLLEAGGRRSRYGRTLQTRLVNSCLPCRRAGEEEQEAGPASTADIEEKEN
jgi:hypothetical protein